MSSIFKHLLNTQDSRGFNDFRTSAHTHTHTLSLLSSVSRRMYNSLGVSGVWQPLALWEFRAVMWHKFGNYQKKHVQADSMGGHALSREREREWHKEKLGVGWWGRLQVSVMPSTAAQGLKMAADPLIAYITSTSSAYWIQKILVGGGESPGDIQGLCIKSFWLYLRLETKSVYFW